MPQPTFPTPGLLSPASTMTPAQLHGPDLLSAENETSETREPLALLGAQTQETRPIQVRESANDSGPRSQQAETGLRIQVAPAEPGSVSTTPQDTPSTDASTFLEQPTAAEPSLYGVVEARDTVHDPEPSHSAAEVSAEELQQTVEMVPSNDFSDDPPSMDPDESPPSSPAVDAATEPPEWVGVEEDTSTPNEEELKEIEASNDVSARDVKYHEESFYADAPEDPEQQPLQKMRLTWVIKGVRGTKEKPNRARIMNSPAVLVGGFYWYLKFFPRGNNSSAISAYVKCSRKEPKPDEEVPENTFSVVYGAPDADLGELKPAIDMSIPATDVPPMEESKVQDEESVAEEDSKKATEGDTVLHQEPANASADAEAKSAATEDPEEDAEDWRVSAQIGIIIYNPEEPRTKVDMAACHQFNKHNDDWGWTNFHGPWTEVHKRRHGQRQALLRNDTLALDAYIRVFNDPSQALWWHPGGVEEQWDSVSLAGYPAMGTRYYHNPGVAGITSWLLLAPFRKIFQGLETDAYRRDSHVRPRSLCAQLQMVLYLLRKQRKPEKFVSLEAIIDIMEKLDELGTDVVTFWEGFRRSIELELSTDPVAVDQIADIFDSRPSPEALPVRASPLRIPVENVSSVQHGIERTFAETRAKQCFPKFLTVELERQKFDTVVREWKLLYDRVRLSEELDLSEWSATPETSKYTLYGFVVHTEERNSGKFYSILRPNGPGSKWLAFDDETLNQVFSYTRYRIQEFEGLEGDGLKENKATRRTAYLAMYIRTDLLEEFLPGVLEPYDLSPWLKQCPQVRDYVEAKEVPANEEESKSEVRIEIYPSQTAKDRHGLIDIQDLKGVHTFNSSEALQHLTVPGETTYQELRQKLAKWNGIDDIEKIKLWTMQPPSPGAPLNHSFMRVSRLYRTISDRDCATRPLCIWMHVLKTEEDVKSFGDPEPAAGTDLFGRTVVEDRILDPDAGETPETAGEASPERGSSTNEVVEAAEGPETSVPSDEAVIVAATSSDYDDSSTSSTTQAAVAVGAETLTAQDSAPAPGETEEPTLTSDTAETSSTAVSTTDATVAAALVAEPSSERDEETQPQSSIALPTVPVAEAISQSTEDDPTSDAALAEDESLIAALISQDLDNLPGTVEEGDNQAHSAAPVITDNVTFVPADPSMASLVIELDEAHDAESPVSEQPGLESMEAASSRPAPQAAAEASNDSAQSDSSEEDEILPSRPIEFCYGFIQRFDAQAQDFIMHGDFLAQTTVNVKELVKKQLGVADDKSILVWRRGNAYRLTSVQASSTFEDIRDDASCYRNDGFILVVSEALSDYV